MTASLWTKRQVSEPDRGHFVPLLRGWETEASVILHCAMTHTTNGIFPSLSE